MNFKPITEIENSIPLFSFVLIVTDERFEGKATKRSIPLFGESVGVGQSSIFARRGCIFAGKIEIS